MCKSRLTVKSILLEIFEADDFSVSVGGIDPGPAELHALILGVKRHALSGLPLHIKGRGVPTEQRILALFIGGASLVLTLLRRAL